MTASARPEHILRARDPEQTQREASDPKASVWVGASAGSGKTKVLTDRVMRLLLDGVKPQRILCLTFTRAAAAEMSNRLTKQLSLWATCSEDELRESLDRLQGKPPTPDQLKEARRLLAHVLSCPGGMRIRTIHAFCQEILGCFPVEARLPPHFAVIDDADQRELIEACRNDVLRALAKVPDGGAAQALKFLTLNLGEASFEKAMHALLGKAARLEKAVRKAGNVEALIKQIRVFLGLGTQETPAAIIRTGVDFAVLPLKDLRQAATWLRDGNRDYSDRGDYILKWLAMPAEKRAAEFKKYCLCFLTKENTARKTQAVKELQKLHPELDAVLHREADRLEIVCQRIATSQIAETTENVLRIGLEIIERYKKRKLAQAALDYNDLIVQTDKLLHRPGLAPWVLYKLDGGLDHILIDEAQDTSRDQWSIVEVLVGEFFSGQGSDRDCKRTLFVVGDEKQSIFSFQDADPDAFAQMREIFAKRIEDNEDELRRIPLHTSFRSAPTILNAVDTIFSNPAAQAGVSLEPIHHLPAPLRAKDAEKIGRVEIWKTCSAPEKDKDFGDSWSMPSDYEDEHDPKAELAEIIAQKIKAMWQLKEILPGINRAIMPGDIMILLRKRRRFANLMVRALKKHGVPVTGVDRMKLTQQLPVMDLLALMQFALLPEDDLNLATVLRGPLLNISEEQLMELAAKRNGSLWRNLTDKAQGNPAFATMVVYLTRWLKEADFITPFVFLSHILNEPCPGSNTGGRHALWSRLGPDALDPIEELLNAAQNFSTRHAPSLQTFLHWIATADKEIKRELDQGAGQVRIMTVHGAKGLEAPIVFLPDTTSVPRAQSVSNLLWGPEDLPIYISRKPKTGAAFRLWNEERNKQMDEYRRLFYVALTRAENRLYICGWDQGNKKGKKDDKNEAEKGSGSESWYGLAKDALQPLSQPFVVASGVPEPIIAFTDPQLRPPKEQKVEKTSADEIKLPAWARQPAPTEPGIFKSLAPSQIDLPPTASPDRAFRRGRIIHRLLQSLPDVSDAKRDIVAARFLANPQHHLPPQNQKDIAVEVLRLLRDPSNAALFGLDSRAEVPLTGKIGGQDVARQVDRLCLRDDEVWIVDYKSNRPPPKIAAETPPPYRQQLAEYRQMLQEIYPGKKIRAFLLWTYTPELMELQE